MSGKCLTTQLHSWAPSVLLCVESRKKAIEEKIQSLTIRTKRMERVKDSIKLLLWTWALCKKPRWETEEERQVGRSGDSEFRFGYSELGSCAFPARAIMCAVGNIKPIREAGSRDSLEWGHLIGKKLREISLRVKSGKEAWGNPDSLSPFRMFTVFLPFRKIV